MIETARRASGEPVCAADVAAAAQLACLLEASASKPGNVSPGRQFDDLHYEDFLASAAAIGTPLAAAATRPLGETVRLAVEATARWTRSNSNLGIVLLLAPIARAALLNSWRAKPGMNDALREAVRRVVDATTVDDAREVYAAIRLAAPGGLGRVADQDVAHEPTVTLLGAMRLASDRDAVAREYATGFELTFTTGAPALARARGDGLGWNDAGVETFLTLLAAGPDTHIVRRSGAALALDVTRLAQSALAAGGVRTAAGRDAIARMDSALTDPRHAANPGTSADLTAAAIFVVLLGGGWPPPRQSTAPGGRDAAAR
jgi:triphosphoribosyl-dephospho-CoA synthase